MKNFDVEKDLSFQVGGESFTMVVVRPEVLATWEDATIPESALEALKLIDERVGVMLGSNGQIEKWQALRARDENAVAMWQLQELLEWMVEVQSARPTESPAPSARGRGKTATTSTDE